jgi:hypothetical protein
MNQKANKLCDFSHGDKICGEESGREDGENLE